MDGDSGIFEVNDEITIKVVYQGVMITKNTNAQKRKKENEMPNWLTKFGGGGGSSSTISTDQSFFLPYREYLLFIFYISDMIRWLKRAQSIIESQREMDESENEFYSTAHDDKSGGNCSTEPNVGDK